MTALTAAVASLSQHHQLFDRAMALRPALARATAVVTGVVTVLTVYAFLFAAPGAQCVGTVHI